MVQRALRKRKQREKWLKGQGGKIDESCDSEFALLNGETGQLIINPTKEEKEEFEKQKNAQNKIKLFCTNKMWNDEQKNMPELQRFWIL